MFITECGAGGAIDGKAIFSGACGNPATKHTSMVYMLNFLFLLQKPKKNLSFQKKVETK